MATVVKLYPDGKLFWVGGISHDVNDDNKIEPRQESKVEVASSLDTNAPVQWMCLLNEARTRNGKYSIPHYIMDGYADDGPPALDQIAETCKIIEEVIKAGQALAIFCPAGKEFASHRNFSAHCVAAHAVLARSMNPSEVAALFPEINFLQNSWVRKSDPKANERLLGLEQCMKALAMANERKWFDFAAFDSQGYLDRWNYYDVTWFVKDEVSLLADPNSTVADPDPNTAKHLSMDGAPADAAPMSAFSTMFEADKVKLIVRLNMGHEMGKLPTYDPAVFEKEGIAHIDTSFPDLHGGCPSNEIVRKIIDKCNEVPSDAAVAFHCKAGFGRSAVCACLWMIYKHDLPGDAVFAWLRHARAGSITTPTQTKYLMKLKGRQDVEAMMKVNPACCAIS